MNAMFTDAMACNARLALLSKPPEATNAELSNLVSSLTRSVAKLQGKVASLERAERLRRDAENRDSADPGGAKQAIIDAVAKQTGFPASAILGRRKHSLLAFARHLAMYRLVEAGHEKNEVARFFGVDRTSVMYGHARIEALIRNGEFDLWVSK